MAPPSGATVKGSATVEGAWPSTEIERAEAINVVGSIGLENVTANEVNGVSRTAGLTAAIEAIENGARTVTLRMAVLVANWPVPSLKVAEIRCVPAPVRVIGLVAMPWDASTAG